MSSPQWKDGGVLSAQNSSSCSNSCNTSSSNSNNGGFRETGIIEKLLHSYGFIQCCDRDARLFFHYSQFTGNIEHLKIGDPVEFEMTYDRKTGKPIASMVVKIASEIVECEVVSEERVSGVVTTIAKNSSAGNGDTPLGRISYENRGECFFLPFTAEDVDSNWRVNPNDVVTFQIATDKRTGSLHARHIKLEKTQQPQRYQGVVCTLKESFGFIERGDIVREIFFHFSEAKGIKELMPGDDVEFGIQTRNGKEVAVNMSRLPVGTVIFDDIDEEKLKGQVIKCVEKGLTRHQSDPFPGRIRCRKDGKDVEIPFGEKDQLGECTLMVHDCVQFNIATDRRDQLQRATDIELLEESFNETSEKRELGVIAAIKEGFGFIKCQDRDSRMFFHFSELLDSKREVKVHDDVEFTVLQDPSNQTRHNAVRIRYLPHGSVKFDRDTYTGVVDKEPRNAETNGSMHDNDTDSFRAEDGGVICYQMQGLNETVEFFAKDCDHGRIPKVGDKVSFAFGDSGHAIDVKIHGRGPKNGMNYTHQGFIAALKDGFGFIEALEHDREIFFHFSIYEGDATQLELGAEVEYNLVQKNAKISAETVRKLANDTIPAETIQDEEFDGVVVRSARFWNPEQDEYAGLISFTKGGVDSQVDMEDAEAEVVPFGITSLAQKRDCLQKGDVVTFQIGMPKSSNQRRAVNVRAQRKKMQATVEAIKGQYGFLSHKVEDGKKLFFHTSEVKDGLTLQPGDRVEFVIVQRTGRYSARNIVKINAVDMPRPERLINRLKSSSEDGGPRLTVIRQPRGPDGTNGFKQPRETRENETANEVAC